MKISPRFRYWCQFLGSLTLGWASASLFLLRVRETVDAPFSSNAPRSSALSADARSPIGPATHEQDRILAIERTYAYPAIRMAQIELASTQSLQNYFRLYTQSPTLRVQWLATLSGVSPHTAGHYQRLAADLHADSATTSAIIASGLYLGTFANKTLSRSSLAELRGAFRAELTSQTLAYDPLESNEPHYAKALALEAFSLPLNRYIPLKWAGAAYFNATREHPDFLALSSLAAVDAPFAFQQCASLRASEAFIFASSGVTSPAFASWMKNSLDAAESGWLDYGDFDTIILRWALYSPESLLQWIEKLALPATENKMLQRSVGQYLALTQWTTLDTFPLHKHSAELLSGVVRGLCQIDPSMAKKYVDKRQLNGQDILLESGDHSLIASELSYEHPATASAHFATYIAQRLQTPGGHNQDYEAMRVSERIYNALVDINAEVAIEETTRLTQSARAIALVQLYKSFLLKNDRKSSERALQILRVLDDGAFRSAVVQGYGMQVQWDVLEGHDIDPKLKSILQHTGMQTRGALLPTLTK